MLATVAQLKARYGITGETDDEALEQMLIGVSDMLGRATGRVWAGEACLELAERTQRFSPEAGQSAIFLQARPVVEISEVTEALFGAFDDAEALVEGDDFYEDNGALIRIGTWLSGIGTVEVAYKGGYTPPDVAVADDYEAWGSTTAYVAGDLVTSGGFTYECVEAHTSGETFDAEKWQRNYLLPADLTEAALQQAGYFWQRRSALGMSGAGAGQGGSFSAYAQDDLLPGVQAIVARYRSFMG